MAIWVLTKEYNDYDQHGEYFIHAWNKKPTAKELEDHGVEDYRLEHVLSGGGRQNFEYDWYALGALK